MTPPMRGIKVSNHVWWLLLWEFVAVLQRRLAHFLHPFRSITIEFGMILLLHLILRIGHIEPPLPVRLPRPAH
jgi:hypothetical protein